MDGASILLLRPQDMEETGQDSLRLHEGEDLGHPGVVWTGAGAAQRHHLEVAHEVRVLEALPVVVELGRFLRRRLRPGQPAQRRAVSLKTTQ